MIEIITMYALRICTSFIVLLLIVVPGIGCSKPIVELDADLSDGRYFDSPEQAVTMITKMLRRDDWRALASYYMLEGSTVSRSALVSGDYFIRRDRPEAAHPGGFWRYRHPFPAGFEFGWVKPMNGTDDIIKVNVTIEIDQGGGMMQRGIDTFLMRKSQYGYKIVPE